MPKKRRGISDGMYMVILAVNVICLVVICSPIAAKSKKNTQKANKPQVTMEVPLPRYEEMHGISGNQSDVRFVEFEAAAVVSGSHDDVILFERLQRTHQNRMKEVMDQVIRSSDEAELQQPTLNTVRTGIRDGLNRMFEKQLVDEIHFGSFRVFEMPRVHGGD